MKRETTNSRREYEEQTEFDSKVDWVFNLWLKGKFYEYGVQQKLRNLVEMERIKNGEANMQIPKVQDDPSARHSKEQKSFLLSARQKTRV